MGGFDALPTAQASDSPSLLAYRRSCVYQVVFAAAKYLASEDPQIKIEAELLDALRSQLQTAVNLAKQYPPITETEQAWLDRVTLPYPWTKRSHPTLSPTLDSIADDELLDRVWGEPDLLVDPSLIPTAPIVDLQTVMRHRRSKITDRFRMKSYSFCY